MIRNFAWRSARGVVALLVILLLALVPVYSGATGEPYFMTLFLRIMIFALAALSLAFILGYGGMVSFGHALYLGVGAYSVGILSFHGITAGWMHLATACVVSALVAVLTGLVCLRTSGMAFIMITLAFAQMFFFLMVSLRFYGGDDGLTIGRRSDFGAWLDIRDTRQFYYAVFALLMVSLYFGALFVHSRFGMVLRGCKLNERRMSALGYPTLRYRLVAYVVSAVVCGVAGVLLANLSRFASPEFMSWSRSGDLILMVVLGGVNSLLGSVVGALVFMSLEEVLARWIDHPMLVLGPAIVIVVLTLKQGLYGSLIKREARRQP